MANLTPKTRFQCPGRWILVKYICFSSKKLSKMKLEFILKVEVEVEVAVEVEVEVEVC
jgi:hypothetical protein